jgi:hypothetical protein
MYGHIHLAALKYHSILVLNSEKTETNSVVLSP